MNTNVKGNNMRNATETHEPGEKSRVKYYNTRAGWEGRGGGALGTGLNPAPSVPPAAPGPNQGTHARTDKQHADISPVKHFRI